MTSASITELCNQALSTAGVRTKILSLDEDSPGARACSLWWNNVRTSVLRAAPWGCVRSYASLALLKAAPGTPENPNGSTTWTSAYPPPPWLYEYAYPTDCLQARFIVPGSADSYATQAIFGYTMGASQLGYGSPVRSMMSSTVSDGQRIKTICTDQARAILCYTADNNDANVFDSDLSSALTYALAAAIGYQLNGDKQLIQINNKLAEQAIEEAKRTDGNESLATQDIMPDWLSVRNAYTPFGNNFLEPFGPYSKVSV